jgi:hypothetical protein
MEQRRRDRVVLVERGRRVLPLGFLERYEEQVRIRALVPDDAGLLPGGPVEVEDPERRQHVVHGVPRMDGQRYPQWCAVRLDQFEWIREVIRPLVQHGNQLAHFLDDGRMGVEERHRFSQ